MCAVGYLQLDKVTRNLHCHASQPCWRKLGMAGTTMILDTDTDTHVGDTAFLGALKSSCSHSLPPYVTYIRASQFQLLRCR
jgi:uncharacterized membrane protein